MKRWHIPFVGIILTGLVLLMAGCTTSPPPAESTDVSLPEESKKVFSAEEIRESQIVSTNFDRARKLLESGEMRAGQGLNEVLERCTPYQIEFVDRYAFIEFSSVPNLCGLSLMSVDGKLVRATDWGCTHSTTISTRSARMNCRPRMPRTSAG